jgi:hypothetical protein
MSHPATDDALLDLLESDVRRGWYKLALRHAMMLQRLGNALPAELTAYCDVARRRCSGRELKQIELAVDAWVSMVSATKKSSDAKIGFEAPSERRSPWAEHTLAHTLWEGLMAAPVRQATRDPVNGPIG